MLAWKKSADETWGISRLASSEAAFFFASSSPSVWFFFLRKGVSGRSRGGARGQRTVLRLFGLAESARDGWRGGLGAGLTDDSLHLRKLARLLLHAHGCDAVVVCVRVEGDGRLIVFGGALCVTDAKSWIKIVGCCCRRPTLRVVGPRNSNSSASRRDESDRQKGSR